MALTVRCLETGYYGEKRYRAGREFHLTAAEDFSPTWMEAIDFSPKTDRKPLRNRPAQAPKQEPPKERVGSTGDQVVI